MKEYVIDNSFLEKAAQQYEHLEIYTVILNRPLVINELTWNIIKSSKKLIATDGAANILYNDNKDNNENQSIFNSY